MAGGAPSVLVASGDKVEQGRIVSALQARQLAVDAVADAASALTLLKHHAVDLAVITAPRRGTGVGTAAIRAARRLQPALKTLFIVDADDFDLPNDPDRDEVITRPFDESRLAARICDLLLRDPGTETGACPEYAAEFGIGAARLACLQARRGAAETAGAEELARDLVREIEAAAVLQRTLQRLIAATGDTRSRSAPDTPSAVA
jgi:CheY-like chemotaxis protein